MMSFLVLGYADTLNSGNHRASSGLPCWISGLRDQRQLFSDPGMSPPNDAQRWQST